MTGLPREAAGQEIPVQLRFDGQMSNGTSVIGKPGAFPVWENGKDTPEGLGRCAAAGISQCARQLAMEYEGIPSGLSTPVEQDFVLAYVWHAISLPGLGKEEKTALLKELEKRRSALTDRELAMINAMLAAWPESIPPARLRTETAAKHPPEAPETPTPEQLEALHKKAGEDDPEAMRELADCLLSGKGMPRNRHAAEILLKKAGKLGNRDAERQLGLMYLGVQPGHEGASPEDDESEQLGLAVLSGLARRGDTASAMHLMDFYSVKDTPGSREQAAVWGLKAAEAGSPEAMPRLAEIYKKQDKDQEADYWLERAALAGNLEALDNLIEQALLDQDARASGKWLMVLALQGPPEQRSRARSILLDILGDWGQKDTEPLRQGMQEGEAWHLARLLP